MWTDTTSATTNSLETSIFANIVTGRSQSCDFIPFFSSSAASVVATVCARINSVAFILPEFEPKDPASKPLLGGDSDNFCSVYYYSRTCYCLLSSLCYLAFSAHHLHLTQISQFDVPSVQLKYCQVLSRDEHSHYCAKILVLKLFHQHTIWQHPLPMLQVH